MANLSDLLYGGVFFDEEGEGGPTCSAYLSTRRVLLETAVFTGVLVAIFVYAIKTCTRVRSADAAHGWGREEPVVKRVLLVAACLQFGFEIAFKLVSRQGLFLMNLTHLYTAAEIYLLASKPGRASFSLLRLVLYHIHEAGLAMLFPEVASRQIPGSLASFYLQHVLIMVVPPYLMYEWGPRSIEPRREWSWAIFSLCFYWMYTLYVLYPVSLLTEVNLNYVLCPAPADPFNGPNYHISAFLYQTFCVLTFGKALTWVVDGLRSKIEGL